MSTDLQELFDQAGRTAPPSRLQPDAVLHSARQRRARRRAKVGLVTAAVASAAVVAGLVLVAPALHADRVAPPVAPTPPNVHTAFWYMFGKPVRTGLVVVSLDNDSAEAVTVSGLTIDRDPTGGVVVDGTLGQLVAYSPTDTTISAEDLSYFDHPAVASMVVPPHRSLLVALRVRPASCAADPLVPSLTFSVHLRSASGAESELVVPPSASGTPSWIEQDVKLACAMEQTQG